MTLPVDMKIATPKTPTLSAYANGGVGYSMNSAGSDEFNNITPKVNAGLEKPGGLFATGTLALDYEHRRNIETSLQYKNLGPAFTAQAGYNRTQPGIFANASATAKIAGFEKQLLTTPEKVSFQGNAGYRFIPNSENKKVLVEVGPFVDVQKYNSLNQNTTFAGLSGALVSGNSNVGAKFGVLNKKPALECFFNVLLPGK